MTPEKLLKGISDILKKHESFFNENPEMFYVVQDRLFKAIDYEDWEGESQDENEDEQYYDEPNFLDDPEAEEEYDEDADYDQDGDIDEDEASKWLKENDRETYEDDSHETRDTADQPYEEADEAQDDYFGEAAKPVEQDEPAEPEQKKARSSRYMDWRPKDKYEDHHADAISKYMNDGYSHREAERLANAHDAPSNFYDALNHNIKPSEPSPKMLEHLREMSHGWLKDADRKINSSAEAEKNPIRHASSKMLTAHDDAHKDFAQAYNDFLGSDHVKGLSGRERHNAIKQFKSNWHESNPDYKEKAIAAADSGRHLSGALESRAKFREEGQRNIAEAGLASAQEGGESFSETVAGQQGSDIRAAGQSVGAEQSDEGGFSVNIKKDPIQSFAQRFPDYTEHLKQKLSPEQSKRMAGVNAIKQKTSPAVIRKPKTNE